MQQATTNDIWISSTLCQRTAASPAILYLMHRKSSDWLFRADVI